MGLWSKICEKKNVVFQILDLSSDDFSKAVEKVKSSPGKNFHRVFFRKITSIIMLRSDGLAATNTR